MLIHVGGAKTLLYLQHCSTNRAISDYDEVNPNY